MTALRMLDHLVFASRDLDAGVAFVEDLLGISMVEGGRHAGLGTRNAIASLGPRSYLEVVGVDPDQPAPEGGRWLGVDEAEPPRLVTWAVHHPAPEDAIRTGRDLGLDLGGVVTGGRTRPDGVELSWRFSDPRADRLGGVLPFFIDWSASPHPATGLESGLTCLAMKAGHPDPSAVRRATAALGVDIEVETASEPWVGASIQGPRGTVLLR